MLTNALCAHLAELGIIGKLGRTGLELLITLVDEKPRDHDAIPPLARESLLMLIGQIRDLHARTTAIEKQIHIWHRSNEVSRRLE